MAEVWGEELRQAEVPHTSEAGGGGVGGGGVGAGGGGGEADSMEGTTVPWRGVSPTPRTLPELGDEEEDDCVEVLSPEQAALRAAMGGDLPLSTLARRTNRRKRKGPGWGGVCRILGVEEGAGRSHIMI